jgi:hypothetical protein
MIKKNNSIKKIKNKIIKKLKDRIFLLKKTHTPLSTFIVHLNNEKRWEIP